MQPTSLPEHRVYLALGGNLGDRWSNLRKAVVRLSKRITIEQRSSVFETAPAYVTDQPPFLNAVIRGQTVLGPAALLGLLKDIEEDLGRKQGQRFGPRPIDIDILLYDDMQFESDVLTVPHPRLAERPFVLVPLAEIAPDLVLPGGSEPIGELAQRVRGHGDVLARVGVLEG